MFSASVLSRELQARAILSALYPVQNNQRCVTPPSQPVQGADPASSNVYLAALLAAKLRTAAALAPSTTPAPNVSSIDQLIAAAVAAPSLVLGTPQISSLSLQLPTLRTNLPVAAGVTRSPGSARAAALTPQRTTATSSPLKTAILPEMKMKAAPVGTVARVPEERFAISSLIRKRTILQEGGELQQQRLSKPPGKKRRVEASAPSTDHKKKAFSNATFPLPPRVVSDQKHPKEPSLSSFQRKWETIQKKSSRVQADEAQKQAFAKELFLRSLSKTC